MLRQVTLHQLRLFAGLARHMNMTRAAEEAHVTPSAFSIQIKQLSEGLGLPLHEQVGKRLFLTDAGRAVAAASRDVLERLDLLGMELAEMQGLQARARAGGDDHHGQIFRHPPDRRFLPRPSGRRIRARGRQPRADPRAHAAQSRRSLHHGPGAGGYGRRGDARSPTIRWSSSRRPGTRCASEKRDSAVAPRTRAVHSARARIGHARRRRSAISPSTGSVRRRA